VRGSAGKKQVEHLMLLGVSVVLCMYEDQSERISWKEASGAFNAFRSWRGLMYVEDQLE